MSSGKSKVINDWIRVQLAEKTKGGYNMDLIQILLFGCACVCVCLLFLMSYYFIQLKRLMKQFDKIDKKRQELIDSMMVDEYIDYIKLGKKQA